MSRPTHCSARRTHIGRAGRRLAIAAAFAGVVLLGACGADSVTGTGAIDGVYTLRTVDNKTLPATAFDSVLSGRRLTVAVTGSTMTLSPDSSYVFALTYTLAIDSVAQRVAPLGDTGSYARSGGNVLFTSVTAGFSMTGTFSNGDLTLPLDILNTGTPLELVYRR